MSQAGVTVCPAEQDALVYCQVGKDWTTLSEDLRVAKNRAGKGAVALDNARWTETRQVHSFEHWYCRPLLLNFYSSLININLSSRTATTINIIIRK